MSLATIVTICNPPFLWGCCLLLASVRYHQMKNPIHVMVKNLSQRDKDILAQFQPIKIIEVGDLTQRNPTTEKPYAILSAETPLVTWMDSDCIVTGNVSMLLEETNETLQIRFRNLEETQNLYKRYRPQENVDKAYGTIPESILEKWKGDVNDKTTSGILTPVSACCFTLHRKYFDFIELWKEQTLKVIPPVDSGTMLDSNDPYFMTDEAVLNSILAFSRLAPPTSPYLLDKDPNKLLVHFVSRPKPWQMWIKQHVKWFNLTIQYVEWAQKKGLQLPEIPWSLKKEYKPVSFTAAYLRAGLGDMKRLFKGN